MVTEWALNTLLAEYLARGLARALRMPESRVHVLHQKGTRTRQPDIRLVDLHGVRIIVQGKIGNLEAAIEDCKDVIEDGLADACFAASYPNDLVDINDVKEVKKVLESSKLDVALVKPPEQLTLEGWPEESIWRPGKLTPLELMELLRGASIYDEIVGVESAENVAIRVSQILDLEKELPSATRSAIHKQLANTLGVALEGRRPKNDKSEES